MEAQAPQSLIEHFSVIDDPRIDRSKLHKLIDILVIAICATICGAEGWEDFELFGNCKKTGSKPFWNCQTAFLHTTSSAESLLGLTRSSSSKPSLL